MHEPGVQSSVNQGYGAGAPDIEVNAQEGRPATASKGVSYGLSSCSLISALVVLGCSAACLAKVTKDSGYFSQNITIVTQIGNWYGTTGGYQTRFGWESFCFKYDGAGEWTCTKYKDADQSALAVNGLNFEYTGALESLGLATYVYQAMSVAFSAFFLLGVCAQTKKGANPKFFDSCMCIGILMFLFAYAATVISFPVMVNKFLDSISKETGIDISGYVSVDWAYVLSFITGLMWIWIGQAGKRGSNVYDQGVW